LAFDAESARLLFAMDLPTVPIEPTGSLESALLGGGGQQIVGKQQNPWHVEFSPTNDFVYWTDLADQVVRRAPADGGKAEVIVPSLAVPAGLAIDAAAGRLYWSEQNLGTELPHEVHSAQLDGSDDQTFLTGSLLPYDLAIDPLRGKLYYSIVNPDIDGLQPGAILRSNLDGAEVEPVVSGLGGPRALAIDPAAGKLYWTDWNELTSTPGHIRRANLDGSDVEDLVLGLDRPHGLALDLRRVPGDANDDGRVDLSDFGILKTNFGTGSLVTQGDFDASLTVDLADFGILKANFGAGSPAAAAVPEPNAGMLAIAGLLAAIALGRPRRLC
jgi:DNA-binding beta-propeller fold protein YncE